MILKPLIFRLYFLLQAEEKKEIALGIAMGAKGYICKPFKAQELFGTVASCLKAK
jgi:DNA-binding response OmpR family regulator